MDYKEKLKNRLNLKFQPIASHRYSVKKLQSIKIIQQQQHQKIIDRNKSNSQIRLPSIQRKLKHTLDKSQISINLAEIRSKTKSIKNIPIIKVQSKIPIHQTITYLLKNQILTVPKIIGLLQKSRSDQFLYMKVKGIYQYQVCDQNQKGASYVTVSSNGMVADGQLITLQNLVKEFDIYSKLKKVHFFKYFSIIKFMNKWNRGSKKANFIVNQKKISKLMHLQNPKILEWKRQLTSKLIFEQRGGWLSDSWAVNMSTKVQSMKSDIQKRLAQISYEALQKFELPISSSTELMNKVLGNLVTLNMTFEKKIRIQRQLDILYKFARYLQFFFFHSIGTFLLAHLTNLTNRIQQSVDNYNANILTQLEQLDVNSQKYVTERQRILVNSSVCFDIQYKIVVVDHNLNIEIVPNSQDLSTRFLTQIKQFISLSQSVNLNLVRNSQFAFITNNIIKGPNQNDQKNATLKDYIYSIPDYLPFLQDLKFQLEEFQQVLNRRVKILDPFIKKYKQFKGKIPKNISCIYQDIVNQYDKIQEGLSFTQKLHDGQFFLFGYLSHSQIKKQIIQSVTQYRTLFLQQIPITLKKSKKNLVEQIQKHLQIMSQIVNSPSVFITVSNQSQIVQQLIPQFSVKLQQIQRVQQFYQKVSKNELSNLTDIKIILQNLRNKLKNFKQSRQNNFIIYRKQLQSITKQMIQKVQILNTVDDQFYNLNQNPKNIHQRIIKNIQQLKFINQQVNRLNQLQSFYSLKITTITKLQVLIIQYQILQQIWKVYSFWKNLNQQILYQIAYQINYKDPLKQFQIGLRRLQKYSKNIQYGQICKFLIEKIQIYQNCLEVVQDIQSQHLRNKDYKQIQMLIQKQLKIQLLCKTMTINDIFIYQISSIKIQINQICFKSKKQLEIQQMINQFKYWWKQLKLQYKQLQQYPLIIIFGNNQKIRKQIQQQTTFLVNILNHKYGGFIRKQCNLLLKQMNNLTNLLELAINHQQKFLDLFPILTSKYAEKQFSTEFKKFDAILNKTMKHVRVLIKPTQGLNQNTHNLLNNHIKLFDSISKVLGQFLQKKRVKFQRFYFLQDDQMLQVLVGIAGQSNIFRMFDGIKGWLTNSNDVKIGVQGVGGQQLVLKGWSYKNQQPQLIFKYLQDSIKTTLNSIVRHILFGYQMELKQLKNLYQGMPWMCIYTVQMILFTKQVQLNCFQQGISLDSQLGLIQQSISNASSSPINNSNYITMLLFLHHFTQQLKHKQVNSVFRFQWNSFLRYYHHNQTVTMRALGGQHIWGGQYQGFWNLMINTSDIRRAHACVLGNLKYGNGVLLQGPSGTGKTQSLKQLARCMAKYCVLFNCSSQINIKTLQKLLSGLCYTASWLCLDQINRLTTQVMSVVANQITTIRNAILQNKQIFNFLGKDIKLKNGVGIFSTMNPIYLRRAKLTQNLKQYFRIISVNIPDYQKILQVLLHSLNFTQASNFAKKISKMFKNLSIQLDDHQQYDFGLRAMKFLIFNITNLRNKTKNQQQAIINGLIKSFYGRLDPYDIKTFQKVIMDTFGKYVQFPKQGLQEKLNSMKGAPQTGTIILGPTSAKTTLIQMYIKSLGEVVNVHRYNPISLHNKYFMGQNILGRWQQGIMQKIARQSLNEPKLIHILILDSHIKSQTIQNFNTLLDQSKILSLPNGTRLKVHNNFQVIMQTMDLSLSSPATVTRCNIIYVSQNDISQKDVINKILPKKLPQDSSKKIIQILQCLKISQILYLHKLYPLLMFNNYQQKQWSEGNIFGFQKILVYCIQLLGFQQKIKKFIHKDNSVSHRKSVYNYTISFDRYQQGQFIQIFSDFTPIFETLSIFIPTCQTKFYDFIIQKALKQKISLLWTGSRNIGKTIAIKQSLSHFQYLRLPITKFMTSTNLVDSLDDKITIKKQSVFTQPVIICIDNIGMANQQSSQTIRFLLEFNKIFFFKISTVSTVSQYTIIAQQNQIKSLNQRVSRHFAQLKCPISQQQSLKSIYTSYLKTVIQSTKIQASLKLSMDIQIDKIVVFFIEYIKKNKINKQRNIGTYQLFNILNNLRILNNKNTQQITDMIVFLFSELRWNQSQHGQQSRLDLIKLAYNQIYKGKYQQQYDFAIKKKAYFTSYLSGNIQRVTNWDHLKQKLIKDINNNYYLADFVISQALAIMRVLQWQGGYYCLVGPAGVGKKALFKIACHFLGIQIYKTPLFQTQRQLCGWIFNILKRTFEKKKVQAILCDLQSKDQQKLLILFEKIMSGHSFKSIFTIQQTDYAYLTIEQYFEGIYDKNNKTYDQIIDDYISSSRTRIRLLISSKLNTISILNNYHYLQKKTSKRYLQIFPIQSITQISNIIMQIKLQQKFHLKKIISCSLKLYNDLQLLIIQNNLSGNYHIKFNQIMYFNFIQNYCKLYSKLIVRYKQTQDILNRSILKIQQTSQTLSKLKDNLIQMEPQIKIKKQKIIQVVPLLESKKKASQEVKYLVQSQKRQIQFKRNQVQGLMKQVQDRITKAQPLLNQATQSIMTIKRGQLSQIKNNTNPHPLIKFTIQNLVILLGQNQNWQNIQKVLSDTNLMLRIKNCSPTQQSYLKVRKRLDQNHQWSIQSVSKISLGAKHISKWIVGLVKYCQIRDSVHQQRKIVDGLKNQLRDSQQKAKIKQFQLQQKQQAVKEIENQYSRNINQTNRLQQLIQINRSKYRNAEKIGSNLAQSLINWRKKLQYLKQSKNYIQAHVFLLCCFLYVYPMLQYQQKQKLQDNIKISFQKMFLTYDKGFDPFQQVKQYLIPSHKLELLTYQEMSNQKLIQMLYHWDNQPILLDPDSQAIKWLERVYGEKCTTTRDSFNSSIKTVQTAIKQGHLLILLVENQFDKFTTDILTSKITQTANRIIIEYNKNSLNMHQDFKIILCNKSRNPNIAQNFIIKHQIINFEITQKLIKNSLIIQLLKIQNQQMYTTKLRLEIQRRNNQNQLKQIQQKIIQSLINNKKSLVDDHQFISLLNQSQLKGQFLKKSANQLLNNIQTVHKYLFGYQQLCQQASKIYSSLKKMSKTNKLLNWSIQIFIEYFIRASIQSITIQNNTQLQQSILIQNNYQFDHYSIRQSNSRPTSALSMLSNVTSKQLQQQRKDDLQQQSVYLNQFDLLIGGKQNYTDQSKKGIMTSQRQQIIINNLIGYLKHAFNQQQRLLWGMVLVLHDQNSKDIKILLENYKKKKFKQYLELGQVTQNIKKYFNKLDINQIQSHAHKILDQKNPFTKYWDHFTKTDILLLCKIVRPNYFSSLLEFLIQIKGYGSILQYQQAHPSDWFEKSDNYHPILLVMGEDPLQQLTDYLGKKRYKNVILIAMGQGQNRVAEFVLEKQSRKQNLVILHNLHISQNFYPFLSKTLQQFHVRPPHKNFRLILISSITQNFPTTITATCHKYLIQQPSGLSDRVKYLYQHTPLSLVHPTHRKLSYSISLFHSLINELNKYKPLGWVLTYNFNTSDYIYAIRVFKQIVQSSLDIKRYQCNIDIQQLQNTISHDQIDFNSIRYLIGQVSYVGKLADDMDRQKMRLYVQQYLNQNVLLSNYKFMGLKQYQMPQTGNQQDIIKTINNLPDNPKIYGLHQQLKQISNTPQFLLKGLSQTILLSKQIKKQQKIQLKPINPINHKFDFINKQIIKFNINLNGSNGQYLRNITSLTKIFSLRSFLNPRQFFIQIKKQVANKNQVEFDKIQLIWSFMPKQVSYGISNLKLQGGTIKNNQIDDGFQQYDITLYLYGIVKKKEKDNRKLVNIPLYLNTERQGKINSYGDNTNLLTKVKLESSHSQEFWTLRGTAFIVL